MRFTLLNVLLSITVVSISLAWYIDRSNPPATDISGTWYSDSNEMGYWETLVIQKDGVFTKRQQYKFGETNYRGNVSVNANGEYLFRFTSKTSSSRPGTEILDQRFVCRCAKDDQNNLIVKPLGHTNPFEANQIPPIVWPVYSSRSFDQQSNDLLAEINKMVSLPEIPTQ